MSIGNKTYNKLLLWPQPFLSTLYEALVQLDVLAFDFLNLITFFLFCGHTHNTRASSVRIS